MTRDQSLDGDFVRRCMEVITLTVSYRLSARWGSIAPGALRDRVVDKLDELEDWTGTDPSRRERYRKVKPMLIFAVDGLMLSCNGVTTQQWPLIELKELGTSHGGQHFFELIDQPGYDDVEIQTIAYLCINSGFRGMHAEDPDVLDEVTHKLFRKLDGVATGQADKVTPQAYENTIVRKPDQLPIVNTLRLIIISLGLVALLLVGSYLVYATQVRKMTDVARKAVNEVETTVR